VIISASRRTDIPAFYSDWFYNRIKEGFALVRNPMNLHQVKRVSLRAEDVDCIVFWTKNPSDMLPNLNLVKDYSYYFQFTLNPYDKALETDVPRKSMIIDSFKKLSDIIGPQRVIWRYDPIILGSSIDANYHEKYFEVLANKLHQYTSKCIISFVDRYKKIESTFNKLGVQEINENAKRTVAKKLSEVADSYGLRLTTCAEEIDLTDMGIGHARCIDPVLIEEVLGVKTDCKKDRNQRSACGCAASVDIGAYNTCVHGCIYCYASFSKESVKRNMAKYDVNSPLLCSRLSDEDKIK